MHSSLQASLQAQYLGFQTQLDKDYQLKQKKN